MSNSLKLYHSWHSSCSRKVRLCLAEKGLEFESVSVNLQKMEQHSAAYKAVNPNGVVPALIHNNLTLLESTIINEYLDEVFPEVKLMPHSPYLRAKVREWNKIVDEVSLPALLIQNWVRFLRESARDWDDAEVAQRIAAIPTRERKDIWQRMARNPYSLEEIEAKMDDLRGVVTKMELVLKQNEWLVGTDYSLADLNMTPYLARTIELDPEFVAGCAGVSAWWERLTQRPSFSVASIEAFPVKDVVL